MDKADLAKRIDLAVKEIARHGLNERTIRTSGLFDLIACLIDPAEESPETAIELVRRFADDINKPENRLAIFAAFLLKIEPKDLPELGQVAEEYSQRMATWTSEGLHQRLVEFRQAWTADRSQPHIAFRRLRTTERRQFVEWALDRWSAGRHELVRKLADAILVKAPSEANAERSVVSASAGEPTTKESSPQPSALAGESAFPPQFARLIPLTGAVRDALEPARDTCKARLRAFYTPDLLLALLDMPKSRIPECLDVADVEKVGLTSQVRKYLVEAVGSLTTENCEPFKPFEWVEREDIQLAQDLVVRTGGSHVTELHLLLGVLNGGSTTRNDLLEDLDQERFDHLREVVEAKLRQPPPIIRTRGGKPRR